MRNNIPKFVVCVFDPKHGDEFIYHYNIKDALDEYETRKAHVEFKQEGEVALTEVMSYYNPIDED